MLRVLARLGYLLAYVMAMVGLKDQLTGVAPAEVTFSIVAMTGLFILVAIFVIASTVRMDIIETINTSRQDIIETIKKVAAENIDARTN